MDFLPAYLGGVFAEFRSLRKIVWEIEGGSPKAPEAIGRFLNRSIAAAQAMQLLAQFNFYETVVLFGPRVKINITRKSAWVAKNS